MIRIHRHAKSPAPRKLKSFLVTRMRSGRRRRSPSVQRLEDDVAVAGLVVGGAYDADGVAHRDGETREELGSAGAGPCSRRAQEEGEGRDGRGGEHAAMSEHKAAHACVQHEGRAHGGSEGHLHPKNAVDRGDPALRPPQVDGEATGHARRRRPSPSRGQGFIVELLAEGRSDAIVSLSRWQ